MAKRTSKKTGWVKDAIAYWQTRISESDLGVDFADAEDRCWRCAGQSKSLQRCHVVPLSLGGSDSVENVIPLCAKCHDEAPDVADSQEIWGWIKRTKCDLYGEFWIKKALDESHVSLSAIQDHDKFLGLLKSRHEQVGIHGGQFNGGARLKASSVAWAIRKAFEDYSLTQSAD